jgi:hypothetical protein
LGNNCSEVIRNVTDRIINTDWAYRGLEESYTIQGLYNDPLALAAKLTTVLESKGDFFVTILELGGNTLNRGLERWVAIWTR